MLSVAVVVDSMSGSTTMKLQSRGKHSFLPWIGAVTFALAALFVFQSDGSAQVSFASSADVHLDHSALGTLPNIAPPSSRWLLPAIEVRLRIVRILLEADKGLLRSRHVQ